MNILFGADSKDEVLKIGRIVDHNALVTALCGFNNCLVLDTYTQCQLHGPRNYNVDPVNATSFCSVAKITLRGA